MTQDAPLDQKLEADAWLSAANAATDRGVPHLDAKAIVRAYLSALSRRVPASGGELDPKTELDQLRRELLVARSNLVASPRVAAPEGWPIELDMVTSSQFVARVQSDALTTIALPMIEELSKRPQTVWGDIVKALRSKAEELWHAPSLSEGKAEPAGQHDALPEYDPTSPLSVAEHIYAQCEQTVLSLNGLPEHSRDALISVFGHFKKLELAALSTPVQP